MSLDECNDTRIFPPRLSLCVSAWQALRPLAATTVTVTVRSPLSLRPSARGVIAIPVAIIPQR